MLTMLLTFSRNENFEGNDSDCDCDCRQHSSLNQNSNFHQLTAYIELTPVCNNRCLGCSNVFISDKPTRKMNIPTVSLSLTEWRKIIHKLSPHVSRLSITGGEPTLYKHFTEFTQLLDEYQLGFTLFTNARWPNPEATIGSLQQTEQLKGLLVSLHGQNAPTHEAFTLVTGSFEETIENIKLATQAGIPVTLSTIITRYSYAQSQAVYQLGQELGVRHVVFNRYIGLPQDDCAPTPTQLKQALIDIEAMRVQGALVKLSVTVPQCFHPTSSTGCGAGESFITIAPWGNVKPCNHTPMILGNLRYDSVEQIMSSNQLDYWRNLPLMGCKDCSALSICGGGCRAEAMLNQRSYDALMSGPILSESKTDFLILPDYLHPMATQSFTRDDFVSEVASEWRDTLITSLDGTISLKDLGIKHGQPFLDFIGVMYREGIVEFV